MAFGKDDEGRQLVQAGAFRSRTFNQQARALARNRFPGGGGGGKGGSMYWIDQFQPPIGYSCTIRLLAGAFKQEELIEQGDQVEVVVVDSPLVKFVEHFDGANSKSAICSAGAFANYRDKRKPCHGCEIYWATATRNASTGKFDSSRMSRQNKYAIPIFDYRPYHSVPVIDRETGKVKANNAGKPFTDWKVCSGRACEYCRANLELKVGHSTHWALNYTQLQTVRAAERNIGKSCSVCGNIDCVESLGWMCSSCGEGVIDMQTTTLKPQELIDQTEEEQVCPYCKYKGYLEELYSCAHCVSRGQGSGLRATLFDVDLNVTMMQMPNEKKQLIIEKFSAPHPIAPEFVEAAKPLDLLKKYRPDSIESQAKKFGVPAVAPSTEGQQSYQNPNRVPE